MGTMRININQLAILLYFFGLLNRAASQNVDPCPWRPDSKSHHATSDIGSLASGGDLEIYIDYTVSWEAKKCGSSPVEYKSLKWQLDNKPKNVSIPNNSTLIVPANPPIQALNQVIPNGATWAIIEVGSTIAQADKMEIVVKIDFANHATPPAGSTCGPNPQVATIDGPGPHLTFTDSGHGLFFSISWPAGAGYAAGTYTYPGFIAAKPLSISDPAPKEK
jgi:hypothetical protein